MTPSKARTTRILIAGDAGMDWLLTSQSGKADLSRQGSGAIQLTALARALADGTSFTVEGMDLRPENDTSLQQTYSLWSPADGAWRQCAALGVKPASGEPLPAPVGDADIVVLYDANLGFRADPARWPAALQNDSRPWVILHTVNPVARGPLWELLLERHADRLVVLAAADDLRLTDVQISAGISWERTAQDVVWELVHNPRVNSLARAAHTVLSFGRAGAVLLSSTASRAGDAEALTAEGWLFFDPQEIESGDAASLPGEAECLAAGVLAQWMSAPENPDPARGIQAGVAAMRRLYKNGYSIDDGSSLTFPVDAIIETITAGETPLAVTAIQDPVRTVTEPGAYPKYWTILHDRHQHDLDRIAAEIVLKGIEHALPDVPFGRFGYLVTVDRQEIESYRMLCGLVDEYLKQPRPKRPLSIGVFGAPGSGKSFGITQVANALAPGVIEKLEFNLSQMNSSSELPDALHLVRDMVLKGKIPLVFWDEFDSTLGDKPLGWLRYFLAPMQDGAFREGQLTHPIGRAIFVFAGGTSHTMAGFGGNLSEEAARAAKVPDFVSRLKGYVNVLGPNPLPDLDDPYFIIRRAILLRSILQRGYTALFQDGVLNVDEGVLRAFLHISRFKHGVRSMETILTMSSLAGKTRLARSCLPAESQLDLHVHGQEFLALVQQAGLEGDLLEALARTHHAIFCETMRAKGYVYGPVTDDEAKTHSALTDWENLLPDEQEQNRSAVRDIPRKLECLGYVMLPARSNEPARFPRGEKDLELLARMEHKRWMNDKLAAGWEYAPETDKAAKKHKALLPWDDERFESEKIKDIELVQAIPQLLTHIGYTVVDLRGEEQA